jgi:hypothetical protein
MCRDVTLDTSSFIWLCDRGSLHNVARAIANAEGRLVLPMDLVAELAAQDNANRAWDRLRMIPELITQLGPTRVVVGLALNELLGCERKRGSIQRTPGSRQWFTDHLALVFSSRAKFDEAQPKLRQECENFLQKQEALKLDRDAREAFRVFGQGAGADMMREIFADYLQWFKQSVFFEFVRRRTPGGRRLLDRRERYRSTLMWAMCQDLTALGAVQPTIAPGVIPWLQSAQRGSWPDNRVAATAAYSTHLLSEDIGLRNKANFAARQLALNLTACSSEEYLCNG